MNNYFLLVVLPNLDVLIQILGFIGIVISIIVFCSSIDSHDRDDDDVFGVMKASIKLFLASVFLFFISCFIPGKKEIIQLKIISVVSELKGVEQIPQKLIDRLNDVLGEGNGEDK